MGGDRDGLGQRAVGQHGAERRGDRRLRRPDEGGGGIEDGSGQVFLRSQIGAPLLGEPYARDGRTPTLEVFVALSRFTLDANEWHMFMI